jgi:phenylpropionate dioxygenase-like ring-hydroxylating dioxygenase large terminal subunit
MTLKRGETAMFVRNAWYVAARSAEVQNSLMPLKLLGERVVLSRSKTRVHIASCRCRWVDCLAIESNADITA